MSPSQGRLKVGEAEMAWICAEEGERIYTGLQLARREEEDLRED